MGNIVTPKMFGQQLNLGHWSTDGLIFYWRGIEAGNAVDESGNGNDGTVTGATWQGGSLYFDGIAEGAVTIPQLTLNDFTIIWRGSMVGAGLMGTLTGDDSGEHYIWIRPDFYIRVRIATSNYEFANTTDFSPLRTYTLTRTGSSLRLYIDGAFDELIAANSFSISITEIGSGFTAGFNRDYVGPIEYMQIRNHALSASEIAELNRNPDLPMQQEPVWMGFVAATGVTIPVMIHHYKQAGGL